MALRAGDNEGPGTAFGERAVIVDPETGGERARGAGVDADSAAGPADRPVDGGCGPDRECAAAEAHVTPVDTATADAEGAAGKHSDLRRMHVSTLGDRERAV